MIKYKNLLLQILKNVIAASLMAFTSLAFACYTDPLIVDLGGDGIELGIGGDFVEFDMLGNGNKIRMQWVKSGGNEAFLALDLNNNGVIDNGLELFGNGTLLLNENNLIAPNGFLALGQYDNENTGGNNDGKITEKDLIWSELVFWTDINADGISTPDEMQKVETFGISSFKIIPKRIQKYDQAGNLLVLQAYAKSKSDKYKLVDVIFAVPN